MPKSLFLPPPSRTELEALPSSPLKKVDPPLLFSMNALRRAWIKVKAVGGAAGADGVSVEQFGAALEANLAALRADLLNGRYRPQRVQRMFVPKPGGGQRPLALWSVRDKIAQRVVYDCIEPYFERVFLNCSYGFRQGRGVANVVQAVSAHRQAHRRWVADVDIKKCFDSLDSGLLLRFTRQQVRDPFILNLIRAWLKAKVFNALSGPQTEAGASQGAVISPLLANVYLHQLDMRLTRQGYYLVRYADDVLLFARRKEAARQALRAVEGTLRQIRLELNPRKSRVVHFDEGFRFVGVFFLRNEHYYL